MNYIVFCLYIKIFLFSGSGACPDCGVALRRSNFRVQLFEDPLVEKEVDIRKRVLKDFNKKEEDFASLDEYNNYLEEVETIIFNLTNNIDVVETNKRIEQYKKENKDIILKNKNKIGKEEYELEEILEEEKIQEETRKKLLAQEEKEEKEKKMKAKEALIDELMFSNTDARAIVNSFAETLKTVKEEQEKPKQKQNQFSTGIKFGRKVLQNFLPVPKVEEGEPFIYKKMVMVIDGPEPPSWKSIENDGYLVNIRSENEQERAGGYQSNIACMRALQEAFVGLFSA